MRDPKGGAVNVHEAISDRLRDWVVAQPMFFVATAPTAPDGHINLSPKGMSGSLAVLGPMRVGYLDYTGSGAETVAHLRENGRITLMFCSFSGPPQIVRLYGKGRPVFPSEESFAELRGAFGRDSDHAIRAIIDVTVTMVSDSCGYAVPLMDLVAERDLLNKWAARKTPEQITEYWATRTATSIDGLPAIP